MNGSFQSAGDVMARVVAGLNTKENVVRRAADYTAGGFRSAIEELAEDRAYAETHTAQSEIDAEAKVLAAIAEYLHGKDWETP